MTTKNAMQLKAFVKNKASKLNISAQLVMQNYMLERLLERISVSGYKNNFIIKGGFLLSAIVGLESRATMDLDATVKGFTLSHESLRDIFEKICAIPIDDDISFEITGISDIRKTDDYPGIRVSLQACYDPMSVSLTVDVTTGDIITPGEVEFSFPMLFEDRKIGIMAYNLETILAEKLETVLSRNIANTRMRDFYDLYILYKLRITQCDKDTLRNALHGTTDKRGSRKILDNYRDIVEEIRAGKQLSILWQKYQKQFDYAKGISLADTCDAIISIMEYILT